MLPKHVGIKRDPQILNFLFALAETVYFILFFFWFKVSNYAAPVK